MRKLINFFLERHILVNFAVIGIVLAALYTWGVIKKEELPDMTMDRMTISTSYPGASAEEVDAQITWVIENELSGIDEIETMTSTSSRGSSSIELELEQGAAADPSVTSEIQTLVLGANLPDEIDDQPRIRQFKSSQKSIIDVAIYLKDSELLDDASRKKLQALARSLENRLLGLSDVSSVSRSGYRDEELQLLINPNSLYAKQVSVIDIQSAVSAAAVYSPLGQLDNDNRDQVSLHARPETLRDVSEMTLGGSFETPLWKLKDIASVRDSFEESESILKVNGREAIILNVTKKANADILKSVDAVKDEVLEFQNSVASAGGAEVITLDDESVDVRNRLSLIASNGLIGLVLILISLTIFLSRRMAFWVAMGIPFTFFATLVFADFMGFSINNMTLAGIIIAMGMIVDDAIVVSENVMRLRSQGHSVKEAALEGTLQVLLPITASILTTIAAFSPLLAFEGMMGLLTSSIPPIVSIMLLSSFLESIFILPSHLTINSPEWLKKIYSFGLLKKAKKDKSLNLKVEKDHDHWFERVEKRYARLLFSLLKHRTFVILFFALFTFGGFFWFALKMQFSLFPRERPSETIIVAEVAGAQSLTKTAEAVKQVEAIISQNLGKEVEAFRTTIGSRHWQENAGNNIFTTKVEFSKDAKADQTRKISKQWENKIKSMEVFQKVQFGRPQFGQSTGAAVEVLLHSDSDSELNAAADMLRETMSGISGLASAELSTPEPYTEHKLSLNRSLAQRLGVTASDVSSTVRAYLEGLTAYTFLLGNEEKDVIIKTAESAHKDIRQILNYPVNTSSGYLIPLKQVVNYSSEKSDSQIYRVDTLKTLKLMAFLKPESTRQPLEIAEELESTLFPKVSAKYPSVNFEFEGEIKLSRESQSFLGFAILIAVFGIYTILAVFFKSLFRPVVIILVILPAFASVIIIFALHGMSVYGLFGLIGALGLSGVVVNDSIVLYSKLIEQHFGDQEAGKINSRTEALQHIAELSSTRLRAVFLTTLTTVAGLLPTAYGVTGYDSMLSEMMLALAWGLVFATFITLVLTPALFTLERDLRSAGGRNNFGAISLGLLAAPWKHKLFVLPVAFMLTAAIPSLKILPDLSSLSAQETENNTETVEELTLMDFVRTAIEKDPAFESYLLQELETEYQSVLDKPAGDLLLEVRGEYGINYDGLSETGSDSEISATLSKVFPKTGLELEGTYTKTSSYTQNVQRYPTSLGFEVSLPLAQNAFGRSDRLTIKYADLQEELAKYQIVEAYEEYLATIIGIYIDYVEVTKNLKTAQELRQSAEALYSLTKSKKAYGIAQSEDVNASYIEYLSQKESEISLAAEKESIEIKITRYLNPELTQDDIETLFPANNINQDSETKELERGSNLSSLIQWPLPAAASENLLSQVTSLSVTSENKSEETVPQRTELIQKKLIQAGILEEDIAKDNLLPSLNLVAGYDALTDNYFTEINHRAYFGVTSTLNFTRKHERAQRNLDKLETKQARADASLTLNEAREEILQLERNLLRYKELITLSTEKLRTARVLQGQEYTGYKAGRSTLTDLISAREQVQKARETLLGYQVEAARTKLDLLRLSDRLVQKVAVNYQ